MERLRSSQHNENPLPCIWTAEAPRARRRGTGSGSRGASSSASYGCWLIRREASATGLLD